MSHLSQEIAAQPGLIANLIAQARPLAEDIAGAIRAYDPRFVCIVARGTSDNAARYAQYLFGIEHNWVTALATPSVHTLYGRAPNYTGALVIGISQSGQSEDVRSVVRAARAQGALTLSLTNDAASPLATEAAHHLDILAGPEKSVAATKTYTAQLTAIALLSAALRGQAGPWAALAALPDLMQKALEESRSVADWAGDYAGMRYFAALGRGYNYATAHEISLKIKELCYIPGEEYSEADFRHGPMALIEKDFPAILVAPSGATFEKQADLLELLLAKGARTLTISDRGEGLAGQILPIPAAEEWLSPIVSVIPGQVLALNLALAKGYDPDRPRSLQKVTSTL
jgi:glucosamine--fructose-6-phosphate aminotransferase (isomerizing)